MKRFLFAAALAALSTSAFAGGSVKLTRDELASIKKKLVAIADAAGTPAGYAKSDEDFDLPTESNKDGAKFSPIYGGVSRNFEGAAMKKGKKEHEQLGVDYQKKMAEAQAKGDFAEMARLGQEMSQQSGKVQGEMLSDSGKGRLSLNVAFNVQTSETLDPDTILLEKPGVIAIKRDRGDGGEIEAVVYFDPVALKNTKDLASAEFNMPDGGMAKKLQVVNASLTLRGPAEAVEAWVKKVDTKTVLAQID